MDCIFCKIANHEMGSKIVFENAVFISKSGSRRSYAVRKIGRRKND